MPSTNSWTSNMDQVTHKRQVMGWDEFNEFLARTPENDILEYVVFDDDYDPWARPQVEVSYFVKG